MGVELHARKHASKSWSASVQRPSLSPERANDWEFFKTTWDREMADAQQEKWGELFAELMQHILNELGAGKTSALSKFMHAETQRVLGDVPALSVPGITRQ